MSALSSVSAFAGLPPAALDRLEQAARLHRPRHGECLFMRGDPSDAVYAVVAGDGRVRIGVVSPDSKGLMVEMFQRGDLFGEIGVLDGFARSAEAVVDGRVTLARIAAAAFRATLEEAPALGSNLCRLLAKRLRRTFLLLQDATFERLEVRLARQILYLRNVASRPTARGPELASRVRQGDLADLLGTTTRSIITILNAWRASEFVLFDAEHGKLVVADEAGLRALLARGGSDEAACPDGGCECVQSQDRSGIAQS